MALRGILIGQMKIEQTVNDWANVKKRWEAWWHCDLYDRAVICVTAPRDGAVSTEHLQIDPRTQWTSIDFMIHRTLETIRNTYYAGEALPSFSHGWSVAHSLYLGCQPHFRPDTVWVDPAPMGDDGYPVFDRWRENPWWHWMRNSTEIAAKESKGRYYVGPQWGNSAGDTLALVRGSEQLLMDLATDPQWVKSAVKTVSDIHTEVLDELWQFIFPHVTGVEGHLIAGTGYWAPKRSLTFDCDISCMISTETFSDIFLIPMIETMNTVDYRVYHLDGPGAIRHLDTLLDVPELHAIEWVPGAGRREILQWIPLLQRIQSKGKAVVAIINPDGNDPMMAVEPLLKEVSPKGLCILASCKTPQQADELIDRVATLTP